MKKFLLAVLLITFACTSKADSGFLGVSGPAVRDKITEKFVPAAMLRLSGLLDEHIKINLEKRLLRIDSATLLSGFVHQPGSQQWIGEHVGKFLFSASNTYRYTRDERLKELMDDIVEKYIATQLPDGYLGTYLEKDRWLIWDNSADRKKRPKEIWDVWVHKYGIIGLTSYYGVTGSQQALETAKKAADLICRTFGAEPGKIDINKTDKHQGMASGSILEPMIDLYRYTADPKYLRFSRYILENWESPTGPRILTTLEHDGKVLKVGNAKAYEMLSCFLGILKYYELTGEERYIKAMQTAWQDIVDNCLYITGTASAGEYFQPDHRLPAETTDHMGEGCVTTTWIQFNEQLLRITGEIKYAEEIEKAVYNHLLAAENPLTGCVSYYTALQGPKPYKCDQGYSCCLSSIPRAISMIPDMVCGKIDNEFSVLLYEPFEAKDSIVTSGGSKLQLNIKAQGDFPAKGKLIYTINPSSESIFTLNFRIPSWAVGYTLMVNGRKLDVGAGRLVKVERKWKANDKVTVDFDMPLQIIEGGTSYPDHVAFKRGPQVLAVDSVLNNSSYKGLFPLYYNNDTDFTVSSSSQRLPGNWIGKQAYVLSANNSDRKEALLLVPFADSGQLSGFQQVWIPSVKKKEGQVR